jgi:hypothetical protein
LDGALKGWTKRFSTRLPEFEKQVSALKGMGIDNFTATGILKQFKLALKQEKCFLLFYREKKN